MKIIINLMLLFIIAVCIRRGFKKGLIGGIITLVLIVISMIVSNALASAFSKDVVPALEPFVGGFIDSETTTEDVLEKLGYGESDYSLDDIFEVDGSLKYDYAYETLRYAGICKDVAEDLADDAVEYAESSTVGMTDAVIVVIANTAAYVGCVTIAFIMTFILLTALVDIFNIDIRLPGLDIVDEISGSAAGFIVGFILCILICWLLGFMGLIFGREFCERDALVNFFQAFRFITRTLV